MYLKIPRLKCTRIPPEMYQKNPLQGVFGTFLGFFWYISGVLLVHSGGFLVHFGGGGFGIFRGGVMVQLGGLFCGATRGFMLQFRGFQVHIWYFQYILSGHFLGFFLMPSGSEWGVGAQAGC